MGGRWSGEVNGILGHSGIQSSPRKRRDLCPRQEFTLLLLPNCKMIILPRSQHEWENERDQISEGIKPAHSPGSLLHNCFSNLHGISYERAHMKGAYENGKFQASPSCGELGKPAWKREALI
jgi:hypothetical protein